MSPRALACPASLKGVAAARRSPRTRWRGASRSAGVAADAMPVADGGEGTLDALCSRLRDRCDVSTRSAGRAWRGPACSRTGRAWSRRPRRSRSTRRGSTCWPRRAAGSACGSAYSGLSPGRDGRRHGDDGRRSGPARGARPRCRGRRACSATWRRGSTTRRGSSGRRRARRRSRSPSWRRASAAMRRLAPYADLPGSGAAGGLGAALASLGAELVPGADAVLDLLGFDPRALRPRRHRRGCGRRGRPGRGRRRRPSPGAAPRPDVRCVVFGGLVWQGQSRGTDLDARSAATRRAPRRTWSSSVSG